MRLIDALRLSSSDSAQSIAFAGSGGKTTALFQLARELAPPVIVTSTAHLGVWQIPLADKHISMEDAAPLEELEHGLSGVILVTGSIEGERTTPISDVLLKWLHASCGYHDLPLLIEADGSRQKPLKAPASHEPAIPDFAENVVYLAGLSGLGKPLTAETVHRPEIFALLSRLKIGDAVTTEALVRVLTHPNGGLKNIPPASKRTLILAQADTAESQSQAGSITPTLLKHFDSVIIASLHQESEIVNRKSSIANRIHAVHENIAGVILAAGGSTRFGHPKQLLDWRGEPFVRAVAKTALNAGLSPVVVVTGANAEQVENAVKDLDVRIVTNEVWHNGQSTSIKAGVSVLTPSDLRTPPPNATGEPHMDIPTSHGGFGGGRAGVGGAIFLLADQPHIGADVMRALIEIHAQELHPIVAPLVLEEQRANPVLFDRVTFPALLELEGDVGGRAIFSKYKVEYMPWHDDRLLLDVDKPEDYERLVNDETL